MSSEPRHFEMQRMEALSNTIFGVAMTLLASQAPKDQFSTSNPKWAEIWQTYGPHLSALLLSFIVSGLFWYSHQRRLAYAPKASRIEMLLNLLFLLSIIVLPVTTGLYGNYSSSHDVIVLYSASLSLISALNAILWAIATWPRQEWAMLVGPGFTTAVFIVASILGQFAPKLLVFVFPIAFIAPFLGAYAERVEQNRAAGSSST